MNTEDIYDLTCVRYQRAKRKQWYFLNYMMVGIAIIGIIIVLLSSALWPDSPDVTFTNIDGKTIVVSGDNIMLDNEVYLRNKIDSSYDDLAHAIMWVGMLFVLIALLLLVLPEYIIIEKGKTAAWDKIRHDDLVETIEGKED